MFELDTSKYEYVFFDFDGTLVDTEELHYEAYKSALKSIGIDYVSFEEHVKINVGPSSQEILRKELRKNGRTEIGLDELILMKKYVFSQKMLQNGVKPIDGAIEFLYKVKQKAKKVALVSGGKYEVVTKVMTMAGIPNIFDVIVTKEIVTKLKPNPESYLKALDMLGADPKKSIAFENDATGVESASKAGIRCVGVVKYDFNNDLKVKYPDIEVISSYSSVGLL